MKQCIFASALGVGLALLFIGVIIQVSFGAALVTIGGIVTALCLLAAPILLDEDC